MPKTRKPRNNLTTDKNVYQCTDEMPDHLKERYATLLDDFDRQVKKKIEELHNVAKAKAENVYHTIMVEMMRLSTTARKMRWEDVQNCLEQDNVETATKEEVEKDKIRQLKEQIASDVQSAIKEDKTKSTARKKRPAKKSSVPDTAIRRSTRKRTAVNMFTPGGMDETVLTSTANATRTKGRRVLQTPGNISMVAPPQQRLPMVTPGGIPLMTPLITPQAKSALRVPKPNEMIYSLNGSPIYTGATTVRRGPKGRKPLVPAISIGIGHGRELLLEKISEDDSPNILLDDEALNKVQAVKNQLEKLLQLRNDQ